MHKRATAQYKLVASDFSANCVNSNTVTVSGTMVASVGGIPPGSTTYAGDQFGNAVAISADGNTLAVGSPMEDSDGLNVDSVDNDLAPNIGFGGLALSGDGNTLVLSTPYDDTATADAGGVYVY